MPINDFNTHLQNVGNALDQFNEAKSALQAVLDTHVYNGYSTLLADKFDERIVTKTQYDQALTSIDNFINIWLPAPSGNGTNIDQYLYEIPLVVLEPPE